MGFFSRIFGKDLKQKEETERYRAEAENYRNKAFKYEKELEKAQKKSASYKSELSDYKVKLDFLIEDVESKNRVLKKQKDLIRRLSNGEKIKVKEEYLSSEQKESSIYKNRDRSPNFIKGATSARKRYDRVKI